MNITKTIKQETTQHADKTALIDGARSITYQQLLHQADELAQILASKNITAGQRIALHSPDGIDYVIAALALLQTGAAIVPIADNIAQHEVDDTLSRIDVHGLLRHTKLAKMAGEKISGTFYFEPRKASGESDLRCQTVGAAFIRFSSGTTGQSKGVVLSHQSILDRTEAANQGLAISHDDVILWVLSMSYHFVVSILLFLRKGATIVIANQFFPFSLISAATKHPVTFIYASPVHYHLLASSTAVPSGALAKVRLAISTSMKMPLNISTQFAEKFGFAPAEAYGIIEIGLPFINTDPRNSPANTVGCALPDYELRIQHTDADGIGQVHIRGKGMFDAYFSPWQSRQESTVDGYFHTGDLGKIDGQRRLFLLGRSKTVLICAGMKIFPDEVEQLLNTHPAISESLVQGRDHPQFGQVPIAKIVLKKPPVDLPALLQELRVFCQQELSSYKVPVEFLPVESIRKTPSGKIARSAMQG